MKLLLVNQAIPPYIIDGGVHVYDLARGLAERGHEVHLLLERQGVRNPQVPIEEYPWEGFIAHQIVPVVRGLDWASYMAIAGKYVEKLHKKYGFDIIHAHGPDASFLLYYRPSTRVVTTVHGAYSGEYAALKEDRYGLNLLTWARTVFGARIYRDIEKIACRRSDAIIAVSPKDKILVARDYKVDPSKIYVVPNGVDAQYLRRLASKHTFTISADRPYVLFVGRLAPRKGLLHLLNAWKILKERLFCTGTLLVVGSGPLSSIVQLYAKKNLDIISLSHVPRGKLMKLYEQADIFVLPSLFEGLPYTLLEAIAFSKPLIISKHLMLQEILKEQALFIDPKDAWEFATELKRLMEDESLRKKLSGGVAELIPIFSLNRMVDSLIKIYRMVLNEYVL